jgi:hypothetical protein
MLINRQEHLSFSPVHSITLIKMSQSSGRLVVDLTETVERTKREPVRKEKRTHLQSATQHYRFIYFSELVPQRLSIVHK